MRPQLVITDRFLAHRLLEMLPRCVDLRDSALILQEKGKNVELLLGTSQITLTRPFHFSQFERAIHRIHEQEAIKKNKILLVSDRTLPGMDSTRNLSDLKDTRISGVVWDADFALSLQRKGKRLDWMGVAKRNWLKAVPFVCLTGEGEVSQSHRTFCDEFILFPKNESETKAICDRIHFRNRHGWLYQNLFRKHREALKRLELRSALKRARRLLQIDPKYYLGYQALADVWRIMGRTDKALYFYEKALSLNPHTLHSGIRIAQITEFQEKAFQAREWKWKYA